MQICENFYIFSHICIPDQLTHLHSEDGAETNSAVSAALIRQHIRRRSELFLELVVSLSDLLAFLSLLEHLCL